MSTLLSVRDSNSGKLLTTVSLRTHYFTVVRSSEVVGLNCPSVSLSVWTENVRFAWLDATESIISRTLTNDRQAASWPASVCVTPMITRLIKGWTVVQALCNGDTSFLLEPRVTFFFSISVLEVRPRTGPSRKIAQTTWIHATMCLLQ